MSNTTVGPRVPVSTHEIFAFGFLLGYLGDVPDYMFEAYDATGEGIQSIMEALGDIIPLEQMLYFARGYETGVAFYADHAHPEERE